MVRNTLRFVSWKDDKAVTGDLKAIDQAPTEQAGQQALEAFAIASGSRYPQISKLGQPCDVLRLPGRHPQGELHNECHRIAEQRDPACHQKRQVFPADDAVKKVVRLAIRGASQKWTMPLRDWRMAMSRLIIKFVDHLDGHF